MPALLAFFAGLGVGYVLAARYVQVNPSAALAQAADLRAVGQGLVLFAVVVWLLWLITGWVARWASAAL